MKCFFCDVQKNNDEKIVLKSENFFSRFDDFPISDGHIEIVPKKHVASISDLTSNETSELFDLVKKTKELIKKDFNPDGFNIGINDGEAAGQSVFHLHVHLIPRYKGDVENPRGGVRNIFPEKADYRDELKMDPEKKDYLK